MRVPEDVRCSKCKRPLDVEAYRAHPDTSTPQELTTRVQSDFRLSVQCSTCGQYTVFTPKP